MKEAPEFPLVFHPTFFLALLLVCCIAVCTSRSSRYKAECMKWFATREGRHKPPLEKRCMQVYMHRSTFVGAVVCRDVQMLKEAIDEGMAAGASQTLLAEAAHVPLSPKKPVLDSSLGWSGSLRHSGRKDWGSFFREWDDDPPKGSCFQPVLLKKQQTIDASVVS